MQVKINFLWNTGDNLLICLSVNLFFSLCFWRGFVYVKINLYCQGVFLRLLCCFFNKPLLATHTFGKAQLLCYKCKCNRNIKNVAHEQFTNWWRISEAYFHLLFFVWGLFFTLFQFKIRAYQEKYQLKMYFCKSYLSKKYGISF